MKKSMHSATILALILTSMLASSASAQDASEREPLGTLQLIERPSSSPVVTIRVVFDAGSAEDPDD
ncbi:MAG: hypothetical protein KC561_08380, partial [Myxococcales bacterium]|nr:hypothetical protein [Myxococcales bacterium]